MQVDAARAGIQRDGRQAAGAVVAGRQVDDTAGGLGDVAVAAFQDGFAAPAVFGQLLERHGPARQVQLRLAGQDQRPVGAQRHLARRQGDAAVDVELARVQSKFRAQAAYRAGLRAGGHGQVDRVAGLDPVDRAGLAREQRREQVQRAAAVLPAAGAVVGAARLVHVQAAAMVGGDAVAGAQVDVGETQRQARLVQAADGLGVRAVAELDAFGLDVQRPWPVPAPLLTTPAGALTAPFQIRLPARIVAASPAWP